MTSSLSVNCNLISSQETEYSAALYLPSSVVVAFINFSDNFISNI